MEFSLSYISPSIVRLVHTVLYALPHSQDLLIPKSCFRKEIHAVHLYDRLSVDIRNLRM